MKKSFFLGLGMLVLLSSCLKEPDPVPTGEARVKFVNASLTSGPQDFYVNGALKSTTSLPYSASSGYVTITSGNNEFAVTDAGVTSTANAISSYGIDISSNLTLFYFNNATSGHSAGLIPDDMTAPDAGKAKVRFVHLNNFLGTTNLSASISGGAQLFTGLGFAVVSPYYSVDPGTKFTLAAAGVTNAPEVNSGIVAGKIYTIWVDGAAATELTGHTIIQN
ncbi:DUF4397 domain-containing protein [Pedobacter metabolipauper]|nr:DUF4397 domain-containing protein [Pedobacter metabolipauper]